MNNRNLSEILKNYTFDLDSEKWLLGGSEILKYQNSLVILVDFKKDENGIWNSTAQTVTINSISDFDPITKTYKINYNILDEEKTERIIPEGFVFNNPEDEGWARRFIPGSLNMKMTEEKDFYDRLEKLYESRETLPIEFINNLRKNKEEILQYCNYIAAVIKLTENNKISSFRIVDISLPIFNKKEDTWNFGIKDAEGNYFPLKWKNGEKTINLNSSGKLIGSVKIIDISD